MDTKMTRRQVLIKSAAAAGLLALGPGSLLAQTTPTAQLVQPSAGALDMAICRWGGEADLQASGTMASIATRLTEQAIEALGGMKRFVSKGDIVWVKPNIGWNRTPELAANTNPDVVATLVRLCLEAGAAKVKVGDNPCNPPQQSYQNSGIGPAAQGAGAEIVYLDKGRFRDMDIKGERIKSHPVYPEIMECDLVISVPVIKHHGGAQVSLCMKNYMGVIEQRGTFHQDLPTCIADLTQFMKPRLSVLDGMRMLTAHGPTGGDPNDVKVPGTVAAGVDIVALDALGSQILGLDPRQVATVTMGEKYGLGKIDYRSLKLREMSVA